MYGAVLRVSVIYVLPYRPFLVSLEPNAKTTFLLPAALLASLHPRLCGALLVAKVTQISTGADARPFLNSTTPLSSNLTVLEFGTVCGNQISMVRPRPKMPWHLRRLTIIRRPTLHLTD